MKLGKFIVIEGVDGSGKTTILESIASRLKADGKKVITINNIGEYDDGTTILGKAIRDKINTGEVANTLELVYMYLASLITASVGVKETNFTGIDKLREEYDYIICSRWIYSTMVYGISKSVPMTSEDLMVLDLINTTYNYTSLARPDLVLVIDNDLNTLLSRLSARDNDIDYFSSHDKIKLYHERYNNLKTYVLNLFPAVSSEWSLTDNRFKYIDNNDTIETASWLALKAITRLDIESTEDVL
jgi:dTMP kinase